MFESAAVLQALFGAPARSLDGLVDFIDTRFEAGALLRLLDPIPGSTG